MCTVQRLLAAATVEIREVDPEHPDALRCLAAYFAELDASSEIPFDPTAGSTAEPAEVRPPRGVLRGGLPPWHRDGVRRPQAP